MRKPKIPMENRRFGRLIVVGLSQSHASSAETWWKCKCDCGRTLDVRGTSLRNGNTKSCGCLKSEMTKARNRETAHLKYNLAGRRFHRLVVLHLLELRKNGQRIWKCKCDCGNYHNVRTRHLLDSSVKSCGCLPTNSPKDLTGNRYGRLTAIKLTPEKKSNGGAVWLCRCDCGNEVRVPASNLKRGTAKSCGCIRIEDITGNRYGKLTVLRLGSKSGYGNGAFWVCRCDCGNTCEVHAAKLKSGHTSSCGCAHADLKNDLSGKRFGNLTVIADSGKRRNQRGGILWKCKCDCGKTKLIRQDALVSGATKSCGCTRSRGNAKIANILQSNKVKYIAEYSPQDLKGKYRFDFAVLNAAGTIEYYIEYDGELHYGYNGKGWNTKARYLRTLQSDKTKNTYCLHREIPLIRIPYTRFKELNIDDLLLHKSKFVLS